MEAAIVPNKQAVFVTGMQRCVCLSVLLAAVKPCDWTLADHWKPKIRCCLALERTSRSLETGFWA
jgi:hypothetical protein